MVPEKALSRKFIPQMVDGMGGRGPVTWLPETSNPQRKVFATDAGSGPCTLLDGTSVLLMRVPSSEQVTPNQVLRSTTAQTHTPHTHTHTLNTHIHEHNTNLLRKEALSATSQHPCNRITQPVGQESSGESRSKQAITTRTNNSWRCSSWCCWSTSGRRRGRTAPSGTCSLHGCCQ